MSEEERLPHYRNDVVTNRRTAPENKLYRPELHVTKRIRSILVTVGITMSVSFLIQCIFHPYLLAVSQNKNPLAMVWAIYWRLQVVVLLCRLKALMIMLIQVYQHYAKSETRLRCCYTPSCSEYAILALKKYGVIIGTAKTVKRLLRCGPPGGDDYP